MSKGPGCWADQIEPQPVAWVRGHEGLLARGVVALIAGLRDVGKTSLLIWIIERVTSSGGTVWLNSKEDDANQVLRPRLDVAGVDVRRVRVSNERYDFPADLRRWAEVVAAGDERTAGRPYDLVVLDSLQRHVHAFQQASVVLEVMDALHSLARELSIGVLGSHHLNKVRGASVGAAIAGAGALQDQAKAIYLLGPEPRGEQERLRALLEGPGNEMPPTLVLACERLGVAPKPESLAFVREVTYHEATDRGEPWLRLVGTSRATAGQVLQAIKAEAREPTPDESRVAQAAILIVHNLADGPMRSTELNEKATAEGFSIRTIERARKLAQVQAFKKSSEWWVRNGWTGAPLPHTAKNANTVTGSDMTELNSANGHSGADMAPLADLPDEKEH
jgi:hypothetical protein